MGTYIPNNRTTCCWCGGANVWLNDINTEQLQDLDKSNKIITCKNSRDRTAVEQTCDTSPIFRSINTISENVTTDKSPRMGLKCIVHNILKDLKLDKKLTLSATKEGALNEFLYSYPTIISKATLTSAIKSGLSTIVWWMIAPTQLLT